MMVILIHSYMRYLKAYDNILFSHCDYVTYALKRKESYSAVCYILRLLNCIILRRKGDLNSRGVTTSGFQDHRLPGLDYLGTYTCLYIYFKNIFIKYRSIPVYSFTFHLKGEG